MNQQFATRRVARIYLRATAGIPLTIEEALFAVHRRRVLRVYACICEGIKLECGSVLVQRDCVIAVGPLNATVLPVPNLPRRVVIGPSAASFHFHSGSRLFLRDECLIVCTPEEAGKRNAECTLWNELLHVPRPVGAFRPLSCPEELAVHCHIAETAC